MEDTSQNTHIEFQQPEESEFACPESIEELQMLKQIIPQMATQDTPPEQMMEMITSRNVSQLKGVLAEKKAQEMEAAQAAEKNAEALELRKQEIQKEYKAIEFEFLTVPRDRAKVSPNT